MRDVIDKSRTVSTALLLSAAVGLAAVSSVSEAARLYQWTNPRTGVPELSGTAPGWYRSDADGPTIRVYEGGRLVDDTRFRVTPEKQQMLRSAAFAKNTAPDATVRRLEQAADRDVPAQQPVMSPVMPVAQPQPSTNLQVERGPLGEMGAVTIARLKALIAEFDRSTNQ